MKEYQVSYYLRGMYYAYVVGAENEYEAIQKVLNGLPEGSKQIFNDFKISRYYQEWN